MSITAQERFDRAYRRPITLWGDSRIPPELARLADDNGREGRALERGCGAGTFSVFLAQQGFAVTGVDWAPSAIRKAQAKASAARVAPELLVGDVTHLEFVQGPFDIALDVGCFHCLNAAEQSGYASGLSRLTRPGSTLLMWGMDSPPPGGRESMSPDTVSEAIGRDFTLARAEPSRRRLAKSHWYWLVRK